MLAEVEGQFLYADDVYKIIPANTSEEDSVTIVQNYIKKWATDVLMYNNAKRNTPNEEEIERLVEEYRKSLIIHQYQQLLIEQRLNYEPTETELKDFYDKFGSRLLAKESLIKGFMLVVPKNGKNLNEVRKWVHAGDEKALEAIEKYGLQNPILYEYFGDNWMPVSVVLTKIPVQINDEVDFVCSRQYLEVADSTQTYFLRINSYVARGQQEPFEEAKTSIENMLRTKAKSDFISSFETELYNDAVKEQKIKSGQVN